MARLLLCHAAAVALWVLWIVRHEVPMNAAMITANGSADDLKAGFHQRRTWARFWPWLGLSLAGSVVAGGWAGYLWSLAGLGLLLEAVFIRTFNPALNVALKLAYKQRFYASPVSASFPDRQVWAYVRRRHPGQPDAVLQQEADETNHRLLNIALALGLAAEVAGLLEAAHLTHLLCT